MRTTSPNAHSAPTTGPRSEPLLDLAEQLYARLSGGHDGLAYNVDARGAHAAVTVVRDGRRHAVPLVGASFCDPPAWQRAREMRGSVQHDRPFNPWIVVQHLRGDYSVAPAAAGWVEWACLDIDAHLAPGEPALAARRLAVARANAILARVWRAFGCTAARQPIVLRSPGGGYHVWFPLTRGEGSRNAEHTWPAAIVRAWIERHLLAAGLELKAGVLEVYPSGRCLRAPCGRGSVLLRATRPDDPDDLRFEPWPDTMRAARVDWQGTREALSSATRHVVPMVTTFVAQWDAQRRTIADWLGRPEAAWDAVWGFLGWRDGAAIAQVADAITRAGEKNRALGIEPGSSPSQEEDEVRTRLAGEKLAGRARRVGEGSALSLTDSKKKKPTALTSDVPPEFAGVAVVRGREFTAKVQRLLEQGITEPSTRHDAVFTLTFYWGATCGYGAGRTLGKLEEWCRAHAHLGSRLSPRAWLFRKTCLREAAHYYEHHAARWRFRGQGASGLATLTPADQTVISAADACVRGEVAAILMWLASRADTDGRIGDPVQIATGLLARLCGDRRVIADDGKRRRSTTLAIHELERLGVLTLAQNYRVGHRGRRWCCWYQFGSGALPRTRTLPAASWAELAIVPAAAAPTNAPAITSDARPNHAPAITPSIASPAAGTIASLDQLVTDPPVVVHVLGERVVPEGLVQMLSDGARGFARTLLALAADVARPTTRATARAPWFVRPYQGHTFTPAELRAADFATVVPLSDLEARRQLTRRQKLAGALVVPLGRTIHAPRSTITTPAVAHDAPIAGVIVLEVRADVATVGADPPLATTLAPAGAAVHDLPTPMSAVVAAVDARAELQAEIGDRALTLPLDVADVAARAWHAFNRRKE